MTDKLREAAQQALGALIQADQRDGMYSYELEIAALRTALAQQDAQNAADEVWRKLFWQAALKLKCLPSSYPDANGHVLRAIDRLMGSENAQQDAQAVAQDEIVAAWKSGMTVQYFVTIGHDDEWTDYTNPTPPDTSGTRLAWRVKPGQRSNAAPTPPARATLTARELLNMMPESIPAEHDNALLEYARDIIEAYKQKNGIK